MKIILLMFIITNTFSCNQHNANEKEINILKERIGNELPFDNIKTAKVEGGIGIIVDKSWCYWINTDGKIYCVNGTSKSIYNIKSTIKCEDAPINATFTDIEKIVK